MIVKLQVPLASNLPPDEQLALIYNRDRKMEVMIPITAHVKDVLRGRAKAYFECCMTESEPLFLYEVEGQNW